MEYITPLRLHSINDFHQLWSLPKPKHPLISVIDYKAMDHSVIHLGQTLIMDYYSITIKRDFGVKIQYGQQSVDFNEGIMFFMAPNQVFRVQKDVFQDGSRNGWIMLIHPDLLWSTNLAKTIKDYDFFHYAMHESLFLSSEEESMIVKIVASIRQEYTSHIDNFSQQIIVSQVETLLHYSHRFYKRQFMTRKVSSHKILERLEKILNDYLKDDSIEKGLPSVKFVADKLNISPNYLTNLLKMLTGDNTQQHIQNKILEKAKEKLSTTDHSISQIAYELGFGYPQSFNKFFKARTKLSPIEFRLSLH
ncbi:helix-turn-helix domain-containing protein [Sphingobacterium oryzagri]|uniref:Helix-turn-helix domain-containing protein n=1 Tax=Sphingobacterium oryzagri TaxID=3025669 RepID=A0ABY7WBP1_9SPHI|nr:helix-turn-helix domain-containing protein [Sphingobacterium sp. KACC 22765]WDF67069.1 helix-turn-helix domain-containing protein [Sphingobacterium sp. KACC 22765]